MITISSEVVTIKPSSMQQFQNEILVINLMERKLASLKIHEPSRVEKYAKMILNYRKIYNMNFYGMILEIITTPTKESASMKTITHELIYTNAVELNSDFSKLCELINK